MRSGDRLATVVEGTSVSEALVAMTEARAGACLVLDGQGMLAGIFTHGDFVRAFQKDGGVGGHVVDEFMTRDPISVEADALAAEALKMIGDHRVDDVVVLESRRPTGGLDRHPGPGAVENCLASDLPGVDSRAIPFELHADNVELVSAA